MASTKKLKKSRHKVTKLLTYLIATLMLTPPLVASKPLMTATLTTPEEARSPFHLEVDPDRPRSLFFAPLASFFLPGLDQWYERQYTSAMIYTGAEVVALTLSSTGQALGESLKTHDFEIEPLTRASQYFSLFGNLLSLSTKGMSAYHSFRSAVRTHKQHNRFSFLTKEETPLDILKAPFKFEFLRRPSTYLPLAIVTTMNGLNVNKLGLKFNLEHLNLSLAISYNAGTWEEAVFRGWLMPLAMDYTDSPHWSNALSSAVFAAAHLPNTPVPLPQFLLGLYFGYLTQNNDWTIAESIFIHAWWDVFAFGAGYIANRDHKTDATIWLPPIHFSF